MLIVSRRDNNLTPVISHLRDTRGVQKVLQPRPLFLNKNNYNKIAITILRSKPLELLYAVVSEAVSSGSVHGTQKVEYFEGLNAQTEHRLGFEKGLSTGPFFSFENTYKS